MVGSETLLITLTRGILGYVSQNIYISRIYKYNIFVERWRLARPGHLCVCGRKNEPCSSSRRLVSR